MEFNITKLKGLLTGFFAVLTSLFGVLTVPIILMVSCNLIDYATGLAAARYREQDINSYKSIRGIIKKVCMWLLVVVGAIVDQLIVYASSTVGLTVSFTFLISAIVAIWIICNELISILENLKDIGVPIPSFLDPIVKQIKSHTETITKIEKEESDNG